MPEIRPRPQSASKQPTPAAKSAPGSSTKDLGARTDIQQLKQKRQQLEQESQKMGCEFDYLKEMIKGELKKHQKQETDENVVLTNLEQVARQTKLNYEKFRCEKLISKLGTIIKQKQLAHSQQFLAVLRKSIQKSNMLLTEYLEFRNFKLLQTAWLGWRRGAEMLRNERKTQEAQIQEKYQLERNKLASEFRAFCLISKFFKAWIKYTRTNRLTKHFDKDQSNIKVKVNQFLSEMQQQIVKELEKEKADVQQLIRQTEGHVENDELSLSEESLEYHEDHQELNIQPIQLLSQTNHHTDSIEFPSSLCQLPHQFRERAERADQFLELSQQQLLASLPENDKMQSNVQTISQSQQQKGKGSAGEANLQMHGAQKLQPSPHIPENPWKCQVVPSQEISVDVLNMIEENRMSIQQSNQRPSLQSQQSLPQKQGKRSVEKKSAVSKELEDKAKKRKEMNEIIKKKHEEKLKKQEEEKQQQELMRQAEIKKRKEEEYRRLQDKRRQEQEMKERMERQKFEDEYKTEVAIKHYEKQAQKFQIFIPIIRNWECRRYQMDRAEIVYRTGLQKKLLCYMRLALQIIQEQKNYEESIKLDLASTHYVNVVKLAFMRALRASKEEGTKRLKEAVKVRHNYLIRRVMTGWFVQLPELRAENLRIERVSNKLIDDFRRAMLLKTWFYLLRANVRMQIVEKNSKKQKEVMWNKVNQWLTELDKPNEQDY